MWHGLVTRRCDTAMLICPREEKFVFSVSPTAKGNHLVKFSGVFEVRPWETGRLYFGFVFVDRLTALECFAVRPARLVLTCCRSC